MNGPLLFMFTTLAVGVLAIVATIVVTTVFPGPEELAAFAGYLLRGRGIPVHPAGCPGASDDHPRGVLQRDADGTYLYWSTIAQESIGTEVPAWLISKRSRGCACSA